MSFPWIHLPPELKIQCIRCLDFKTKTNLRCTSRTEKALVDRVKHRLVLVSLNFKPDDKVFVKVQENSTTISKEKYEVHTNMLCDSQARSHVILSYILNVCKRVDWIRLINVPYGFSDRLTIKHEYPIFQIEAHSIPNRDLVQIIHRSYGTSSFIRLYDQQNSVWMDMLSKSAIRRITYMHLNYDTGFGIAIKIAQHWMEKDVDLNHQAIFYTSATNVRRFFRTAFKQRLVRVVERWVLRIATNNPIKHIILSRIESEQENRRQYIIAMIPSDFFPSTKNQLQDYLDN